MSAPVTVDALLASARWRLKAAGLADAAAEARALVGGLLGLDLTGLVAAGGTTVPADVVAAVAAAAERRAAREPVGRILGRRAFHGLDFGLSPETLEPRPDTEVLVDAAVALVRRGAVPDVTADGAGLLFADVGTGTGAIAVAVAALLPGARGIATDLSVGAAKTARRNVAAHGFADRISVRIGSWLDPVDEPLGLVLSNPPYIAAAEIDGLDPEVRLHDPRLALDGGADGLDAYRALLPAAAARLRPGGTVALEIGWTQGAAVAALTEGAGFSDVRVLPDLAGRDRVVLGRVTKG